MLVLGFAEVAREVGVGCRERADVLHFVFDYQLRLLRETVECFEEAREMLELEKNDEIENLEELVK